MLGPFSRIPWERLSSPVWSMAAPCLTVSRRSRRACCNVIVSVHVADYSHCRRWVVGCEFDAPEGTNMTSVPLPVFLCVMHCWTEDRGWGSRVGRCSQQDFFHRVTRSLVRTSASYMGQLVWKNAGACSYKSWVVSTFFCSTLISSCVRRTSGIQM